MAKYPDEIVVLPVVQGRDLAQGILGDVVRADHHNAAWREIEAIETELGLNPKGSDADVRARLDRIDNAISQPKVDQIIAGENITIDPTSGQGVVTINAIVPSAAGQMTVQKVVATDGSGDYNCDGTDDQVEIQQAIDDVSALGGGTVFLRAGVYNISASIVLKRNICLCGDPGGTILYRVSTGYPLIYCEYLSDPPARVVISGLLFDGSASSWDWDVDINNCDEVDIIGLRWLYFPLQALRAESGVCKVRVDRCVINAATNGVYLSGYLTGISHSIITLNRPGYDSNAGIIFGTSHIFVDNCFIRYTGDNVLSYGIRTISSRQRCFFRNNCIFSAQVGISLNGSTNCLVIGNFIDCPTKVDGAGSGCVVTANW